ncbi:hypothetical protein RFF05_00605 [Bengtsoniella intestinalis]|uniref:hypothetical protein n=1 Tax=Bengtsoniella intestinalis TaxID=3073143 RepID=UPI00391FBB29
MYNNSNNHHHTNNTINKVLLDTLDKVMDKGLDMMGKNPTEDYYKIWDEYVKGILDIIVEQNREQGYLILSDYLSFRITIISCSTFDKFKFTIQRLIEYYKQIAMWQ